MNSGSPPVTGPEVGTPDRLVGTALCTYAPYGPGTGSERSGATRRNQALSTHPGRVAKLITDPRPQKTVDDSTPDNLWSPCSIFPRSAPASPLTNESRYPAWRLVARKRVSRSGSGRHGVPSPRCGEAAFASDKAKFVRHSQVLLDFVRDYHIFQDGLAKIRPRLVESSEVADSPH
jgi:hypothetical protein